MSTPATSELERDLARLEERLSAFVTHTRTLRAANESLRRDLAAANEKSHALAERIEVAAGRLDALLARLPETSE